MDSDGFVIQSGRFGDTDKDLTVFVIPSGRFGDTDRDLTVFVIPSVAKNLEIAR